MMIFVNGMMGSGNTTNDTSRPRAPEVTASMDAGSMEAGGMGSRALRIICGLCSAACAENGRCGGLELESSTSMKDMG